MFVLGGHRPEGTPSDVVVEADPKRLLQQLRDASTGGDVHLIGVVELTYAVERLGAIS